MTDSPAWIGTQCVCVCVCGQGERWCWKEAVEIYTFSCLQIPHIISLPQVSKGVSLSVWYQQPQVLIHITLAYLDLLYITLL